MAFTIPSHEKAIGIELIHFYSTMKSLEKIEDEKERKGKQATLLIMSINDISAIFTKEEKG